MAKAEEANLPAGEAAGDLSGAKDFDFLMGDWRVRHRIKRPCRTARGPSSRVIAANGPSWAAAAMSRNTASRSRPA